MKNLKFILCCLLLCAITLVGCKSASVFPPTIVEKTNTIIKTETVHDTVFRIEKDNSYFAALLECQKGKVVIKENSPTIDAKPLVQKGKNLKAPKVAIIDNKITVDCETEAHELFAKWKDSYIVENSQTNTTKPQLVEKSLSGFQNFQIWTGRICLGAIALGGVGLFVKYKLS